MTYQEFQLLRIDFDGHLHFDYLNSEFPYTNYPEKENKLKDILEFSRDLITSGLAAHKMSKEYLYYRWLASYYNQILEEHSEINNLVKFTLD